MDTVIDSLPSSEQAGMDVYQYNKLLSDIQNTIQNSSAIDSIARKYTDALTKGLRDGKTFNEIDIDIDDELTALSSVTYNSIKDYTDNTDSTITLSLLQTLNLLKKLLIIMLHVYTQTYSIVLPVLQEYTRRFHLAHFIS